MKIFSVSKFRVAERTKGIDWVMVIITSLLVLIGLAFIASALVVKAPTTFWNEFFNQLIYGIWIGGVGTVIMTQVDYHKLFAWKWWLIGGTSVMLLFLGGFALVKELTGIAGTRDINAFVNSFSYLPIRPFSANGAIRWIKIIGLPTFQPSELAKLTMLIFLGGFLQKNENTQITWMKLKLPLYIFFAMSVLILIQPDLGSVLLIYVILLSAMWVSKVPAHILTTITLIVVLVGGSLTFGVGYRRTRLNTFISGGQGNDHVSLAQNAISLGGIFGTGYGNSVTKQSAQRVPELSTDSIITLIGEEMGFLFTFIFMGLYLAFLFRGLKIAQDAPDVGGRALATGLAVWVTSQAYFNIMSMVGLVPSKGIPLPFVSEGGSAMILNLLATGILLNISRQAVPASRPVQKKRSKLNSINGRTFKTRQKRLSRPKQRLLS